MLPFAAWLELIGGDEAQPPNFQNAALLTGISAPSAGGDSVQLTVLRIGTGVPRSQETAHPTRTVIGPNAQAYCRVLEGGVFL